MAVKETFSCRCAAYSLALEALLGAVQYNEKCLKHEKSAAAAMPAEDLNLFLDFLEMEKTKLEDYCSAHPEEETAGLRASLQEREREVKARFAGVINR